MIDNPSFGSGPGHPDRVPDPRDSSGKNAFAPGPDGSTPEISKVVPSVPRVHNPLFGPMSAGTPREQPHVDPEVLDSTSAEDTGTLSESSPPPADESTTFVQLGDTEVMIPEKESRTSESDLWYGTVPGGLAGMVTIAEPPDPDLLFTTLVTCVGDARSEFDQAAEPIEEATIPHLPVVFRVSLDWSDGNINAEPRIDREPLLRAPYLSTTESLLKFGKAAQERREAARAQQFDGLDTEYENLMRAEPQRVADEQAAAAKKVADEQAKEDLYRQNVLRAHEEDMRGDKLRPLAMGVKTRKGDHLTGYRIGALGGGLDDPLIMQYDEAHGTVTPQASFGDTTRSYDIYRVTVSQDPTAPEGIREERELLGSQVRAGAIDEVLKQGDKLASKKERGKQSQVAIPTESTPGQIAALMDDLGPGLDGATGEAEQQRLREDDERPADE